MKKFDVFIGNPPYQKTYDGERKAKKYNLWSEFIRSSMNISDQVALIIPDGWLSSGTDIFEDMKKYGINYTNIGECSKHFPGIGTRFTYVILRKNHVGTTHIMTESSSFDMDFNSLKFISPDVADWTILNKVSNSEKKQGWRRGRGYHTTNHKHILRDTGKYLVHHTNAQTFRTDDPRGDLQRKKVFTTISGYYRPHYDEGKVGVTQATVVCEVDDLENAKSVFDSKLYRYIGNKVARQQGWINITVMANINYVNLNKSWTDQELYAYFGLTQDEIEYIERSVK